MSQEILDFLGMIGVNTQFISLYNNSIFINNLKFPDSPVKRRSYS